MLLLGFLGATPSVSLKLPIRGGDNSIALGLFSTRNIPYVTLKTVSINLHSNLYVDKLISFSRRWITIGQETCHPAVLLNQCSFHQASSCQSAISRSLASPAPENFLETLILRPCPRPTESLGGVHVFRRMLGSQGLFTRPVSPPAGRPWHLSAISHKVVMLGPTSRPMNSDSPEAQTSVSLKKNPQVILMGI